jgi:hypothetical protein
MKFKFLFILGFILLFTELTFSQDPGDIILNEIMYAPVAGNSQEWFEVYNKSTNPVNIVNWKWKDATATLRTITTQNITINPNSFAVICEDSTAFKTFYTGFSGTLLQSSGWSGLNNTGDQLILFTQANVVMDSINFAPGWGGSTGNRSMERINPSGPTNQQTNWGTSLAVIGATPGSQNSLSPLNNDLVLNIISFNNNNPLIGTNLVITANVKNRGQLPAAVYSVSFYEDYNRDTVPTANELITTVNSGGALNAGDSINFDASDLLDSLGLRQYIAKVNYGTDEDTTNNKKAGSVNVTAAPTADSLIVNEIMYAPSTGTGQEWFEVYNKSANPVNLNGWKWKDSSGSQVTITTQNVFVPPGGYAVICQDSNAVKSFYPNNPGIYLQTSWLSLNNTGDHVNLYNGTGALVDNVSFSSSWGGSTGNKSLERISVSGPSNQQSNWGSCVDIIGATPNKINSLTPKPNDLALNKITFNRTIPAIGDTLGITSQVKNRGLNSAPNFTVSFYDDYNKDSIPTANELKVTLNSTGGLNPGDSANYTYNQVLDSAGLRQYISVVTYAPDNDTLNNKRIASIEVAGGSTAGRVIINEIMYDQPESECEWFELFNNSDSVVNLKNWKMQDNAATQYVITANDYLLPPDNYVVISQGTEIFKNHPKLDSSKVVVPSAWFNLSSTGDVVIVYKINGVISDRVDYDDSWGGDKVSLERIDINGISNDSSNWTSSIDCEKSTPAKVNSILKAVHYTAGDLIVNEIMAGPRTGEAEWIELYNPTGQTINITNWLMQETGGQTIIADTCSALIKPGMYLVIAEDTTIYSSFGYLRTSDSTRKVFFTGSLGLNNDVDMVKITDIFRTKIDSVMYSDSWYNPNLPGSGRSLEKINPGLNANDGRSWSSSTAPNGGTPGLRNSIFTNLQPTTSQIKISPNPFSPDGDGWEDFAIIDYKLQSSVSQVRMKIFDVKGRLIKTLLNNQAVGSSGQVVYNGLDDDNRKLRLGIYVVFIEALNDQNGVVETIKTAMVVAARL